MSVCLYSLFYFWEDKRNIEGFGIVNGLSGFLVILRIKIKEVNLLMSCEGKELVLKNCSKWLGNYGLKILESLVNIK